MILVQKRWHGSSKNWRKREDRIEFVAKTFELSSHGTKLRQLVRQPSLDNERLGLINRRSEQQLLHGLFP